MHAANSILSLERILGVFKHPEKFVVNNDKALGNKFLITDKGGMPIFYEKELFKFIAAVRKHHDLFINNNTSNERNTENQSEQISLDL